MKKNTYYFPHDYHARHDPKLEKVSIEMGCEGHGIYWDLVEMMYEEGGKLKLTETNYYANALRTQSERISRVINDFGLFEKDDTTFWSHSVNERLKHLSDKREKARLSVNKRWHSDTDVIRPKYEGNTIKERKVKERKVKERRDISPNGDMSGKPDPSKPDFSEFAKRVIDFLNRKTGRVFSAKSKSVQSMLRARVNEGFTLDDFSLVIRWKCIQWLKDDKMNEYLRPSTLFRASKFPEYLAQAKQEYEKFMQENGGQNDICREIPR